MKLKEKYIKELSRFYGKELSADACYNLGKKDLVNIFMSINKIVVLGARKTKRTKFSFVCYLDFKEYYKSLPLALQDQFNRTRAILAEDREYIDDDLSNLIDREKYFKDGE